MDKLVFFEFCLNLFLQAFQVFIKYGSDEVSTLFYACNSNIRRYYR
jgi:hypothetical protein